MDTTKDYLNDLTIKMPLEKIAEITKISVPKLMLYLNGFLKASENDFNKILKLWLRRVY